MLKRKSSGHQWALLETIARARQCFKQRPQKSLGSAVRELNLPKIYSLESLKYIIITKIIQAATNSEAKTMEF